MNKGIKYAAGLVFLIIVAFACKKETTPEKLELQKPPVGTAAYYENLKAYKQSPHSIAFGWFGGWSGSGASRARYLAGAPDSMDIISVWGDGEWANPTPERLEDLRYVQQTKGTKVTFTIITHQIGDGINTDRKAWPADDSTAIVAYAKAIIDTINKYGYDGFDIDYEPDWCGCTVFLKDNLMRIFIKELGKSIGPNSGTGRLLLVDGSFTGGVSKRTLNDSLTLSNINYFIDQAYNATVANLVMRYNALPQASWFSPRQWIVTESFEGTTMVSGGQIFVMAGWNPNPPTILKGGVGAYHMEYDYPNSPDYKNLRKAIQIMNPAPY